MINNLRQISLILYKLKRLAGVSVRYFEPTKNEYDITTGDVTREYNIIYVRRGILLVNKRKRENQPYSGLEDLFDRGGFFDRSDRILILDGKDLPRGFKPQEGHHIEYDGANRAEIIEVTEAEHQRGYALKLSEVSRDTQIGILETASNSFSTTQEVTESKQ